MGSLSVNSITVPELLDKLRKREWLVPGFQRDFVWSQADVVSLVNSVFEKRPIGMATLWEQSSEPQSDVDLSPVSIPDFDPDSKKAGYTSFATSSTNPSKFFAILDGRQRCTAIAMAFGGLRAKDGKYKHAVRYYLDVKAKELTKRVIFLRESEIQKRKLTTDAFCIAEGLFPLATNKAGEEIMFQWMRYLQAIRDPSFYPEGKMPEEAELVRRDQVLKDAFEGLVGTKLAVYIVPENYNLSEICEIFETLNTTGTKVSTVDLIHSSLYSDTRIEGSSAIKLRDWIAELGQQDGAIGWASLADRPELVTQIVTACYVALQNRPAAKKIAGNGSGAITSVKAADLLSTPTLHWRHVVNHGELIALYLGEFQNLVGGGAFPYGACPYPVSAAIYVALKWHLEFDVDIEKPWGAEDLNAVYKAFFWRNALSNRYDQGFLTQLGSDIKEMKLWLNKRAEFKTPNPWAQAIQKEMDSFMSGVLPTKDQLTDLLADGRQTGALQKALQLPMIAGSKRDLLDHSVKLSYPATDVEIHHIFPKAWCGSTKTAELAKILDKDQGGRDYVDSTANLMPLSRESNNFWKAKIPEQALIEREISFEHAKDVLAPMYIDEKGFNFLMSGSAHIREFWDHRASLMADDLLARTKISL